MNPAPDQPPTSNTPSVAPVPSTATPVAVVSSTMPSPESNPQPASPAGGPPTNNQSHHFPFMMVTLFLVVILAGSAGSFLFFRYANPTNRKISPAKIAITPPVTIVPTTAVINPFATPSGDLTSNPFASPTATNPFGTYQNPFATATPSGEPNAPYQNPFQ